jgi:hypothetical protein
MDAAVTRGNELLRLFEAANNYLGSIGQSSLARARVASLGAIDPIRAGYHIGVVEAPVGLAKVAG